MDSPPRSQATLVDLLDRVLERGLVISADIIVTLAGVPLIGINLRAALAGMDTMVKHGFMKEWDHTIRAQDFGLMGGQRGGGVQLNAPTPTIPAEQQPAAFYL